MRLIDADKVVEQIDGIMEDESIRFCNQAVSAAKGIAKLGGNATGEHSNGWIPCSERLPEAFDNVLISTKEGGRAIAHRCPNQSEGRFYDLHSSAIDGVVAWQPLPEPYKPEGK